MKSGRYGEFCFPTLAPANDQTFDAKWLTDLELSHAWSRLSLAIGAQNVFDVFPDRLLRANSSFLVQTFPNLSPFGFNGRFIYAKLTLKL